MLKVLYLVSDSQHEWNCSEWRCMIPMRAINRSGLALARALPLQEAISGAKATQILWADVIVIQRNAILDIISRIEEFKILSKTVILDVDDAYHLMTQSNPAYQLWKNGLVVFHDNSGRVVKKTQLERPVVEQLTWAGKLVNAITTPSQILSEDWKVYNPSVYIVPNFFESDKYLSLPRPTSNSPLTLGWGGSLGHVESWTQSGIIEGLRTVLKRHPEVQLVIQGGHEWINRAIRKLNPVVRAYVPFWDWPSYMSTFHIGLIPLSGAYDDRRSLIKPLECVALGIPWIGSESAVLNQVANLGKIVKNTRAAWIEGLEEMIVNFEEKNSQAQWIRNSILEYDVDRNISKTIELYERIREETE